jgi:phosphatidylglycerophosphate synthase
LASRSSGWAQYLARRLTASRVTPNQISLLLIAWALLGGALLWWSPGWPAFIACAVCVQLRLLCNPARRHGRHRRREIDRDRSIVQRVPDRLADPLFLVPLGYAAGYPLLGWLAALLAVLTAYVRVLGGALGQPQDFGGLLPKQRRMAVLTLALLIQAIEDALWGSRVSLLLAVIIIAVGSLVTCISRTIAIARRLESPRVPGEVS